MYAVESDIQKLLANQHVVPDNLTKKERSALTEVEKKQTKDFYSGCPRQTSKSS